MKRNVSSRGAALISTLMLMAVLLAVISTLILFALKTRLYAIQVARNQDRVSCSYAGLQVARAYYGQNFAQWNTFLSAPGTYNPIKTSWNTSPAVPMVRTFDSANVAMTSSQVASAETARAALIAAHPELFVDLDKNGDPDVFIYIRDDEDEKLPASNNPLKDNNQIVIVGSVCVSKTMLPRRLDGTQSTEPLTVEAFLSYNGSPSNYAAQSGAGATGSGNLNGT